MGGCQKNYDEVADPRAKQFCGPQRRGAISKLRMAVHTWERRKQCCLFDFQSKNVKRSRLVVDGHSVVFKSTDGLVKVLPEQESKYCQQAKNYIAKFERNYGYYTMTGARQITKENQLWVVVKSLAGGRYYLKNDDILRLGRVMVVVKQAACVVPEEQPAQEYPNTCYDQQLKRPEEEPGQRNCKICQEEGTRAKPLVAICKCTGSLRYIHLGCIRNWLKNKAVTKKSMATVTLDCTDLQCQLCGSSMPYSFYISGRKEQIVTCPDMRPPFLELEVNSRKRRFLHGVSFTYTDRILAGRKSSSELQICDDISLSRRHAFFGFDPAVGRFYVQDNKSKFGTLVFANHPVLVNCLKYGLTLQLGNSIIQIEPEVPQQSEDPAFLDERLFVEGEEKGPAFLARVREAVGEPEEEEGEKGQEELDTQN